MNCNTIISIEGNIGSGKSTILSFIKDLNYNDIIFVDEPVDEWINIKDNDGNNALELFYKDKEKNSFWFQILAYITRLRNLLNILENNNNKIIICERSIYTDKYVFAEMLYDFGLISNIEWTTYLYWFDTFQNKTKLNHIIYIDTEPSICYQRIISRSRNEEINKISLDYLQKCHEKHTKWLQNTQLPIYNINGNLSIDAIQKNILLILNELITSRTKTTSASF